MTDHPITPPPELLDNWDNLPISTQEIFVIAAQWGADQELQACCRWVAVDSITAATELRAWRRPKPPSLKEQALTALLHLDHGQHNERCLIIRRALESIND
jgi:hypothetical protein